MGEGKHARKDQTLKQRDREIYKMVLSFVCKGQPVGAFLFDINQHRETREGLDERS